MSSGSLARHSTASHAAAPEAQVARVVYVEVGLPPLRIEDRDDAEVLSLPIAVLPTVEGRVSAFVIACAQADDAEALLWQIRRHPVYFAAPAYVVVDGNEAAAQLTDGVVTDIASALEAAKTINARLEQLPGVSEHVATPDYRLSVFLFSRPNWQIRPLRTLSDPRLWCYPLADAIADPERSSLGWLLELTTRGFLTGVDLVDRVRECSRCDSALLSFVDVCPDCRSVDIDDAQFLHCFACGHIAPEQNFVRRTGLMCPQCRQRLRHIGVDYDRPMEEYVCGSCTSSFVEGQVVARCLSCGHNNDPAELNSRRIYNLAGTSRADLAARQGELQELPSLVDAERFAAPSYLMQMMEWMLSLAKRHSDEHFSVVTITISNHGEGVAQLGDRAAGERIDGFFNRIAELSRETDLISRISRLSAWVLLPKSDLSARANYAAEVSKIAAQTATEAADPLVLDIGGVSIPEDHPADITMTALQHTLQQD